MCVCVQSSGLCGKMFAGFCFDPTLALALARVRVFVSGLAVKQLKHKRQGTHVHELPASSRRHHTSRGDGGSGGAMNGQEVDHTGANH